MTSIYTTKENLQDICLDKQKQAWLNMIIKLKEVYINDKDIFLNNVDPDDDPFYILDQMQVSIITEKMEYINSIPNDPTIVLQNPNGIFLLDISVSEANKIQMEYGVLCQSIALMDDTPLTQNNKPTELEQGKPNQANLSWNTIISPFNKLPSNSVLIIDAHLFATDKFDNIKQCYDSNYSNGINNVCDILNCILPNTFKGEYHIGILLTEKASSCPNLTNERIANAINKQLKRRLNRVYNANIKIEVIFIKEGAVSHPLIHNRRIISNYFIVTADYKLAALKNGKSVCDQSIVIWSLFENIDKDTESDKKEKRIRIDLKKLQENLNGTNPQAIFYKNGRIQQDFKTLEHRLLTK